MNIPGHPSAVPSDSDSEPDGSAPRWYPSSVRGAPLYLGGWTIEKGVRHGQVVDMVIVATSDGYLHAYDHSTSRPGSPPSLLWEQSLGPARYHIAKPASLDKLRVSKVSNIPRPVGITSTPVIDKSSRRLFALACHQAARGSASYWAYSIEIDTGAVLQQAQLLDLGGPGHIRFDPHGLDQRGGLNLVGGRVYVVFSDLYARDAEDLPHPSGGWIVSIKADDLTHQRYMSVTQTVHGGGMWAPGGASADSLSRLYAATGTGLKGAHAKNLPDDRPDDPYWADLAADRQHPGDRQDYFMSVIQFRYDGDQINIIGWYEPGPSGGTGHDIKYIQAKDNDLGSCSILVLPAIGGRRLVITASKDGDAYLLAADSELGHYDGHIDRVTIFPGADSEAVGAPSYWHTATGDHVVFLTGHPALAALKIAPPAGPRDHWIKPYYSGGFWSALRLVRGNWGGSPVVAGSAERDTDTLVWVAEPIDDNATADGAVYAIRAATGEIVFNSTAVRSNSCGPLPHFPGITAVGNCVFVGTNGGFVCYEHPVRLTGLTIAPEVVVAGNSVIGTVTVDSVPVTGSLRVDLISGDPGFVTIPAEVAIPADQISANFSIGTISSPTPFSDHVTEIVAKYGADVKSARFTITSATNVGRIQTVVLTPAALKGGAVGAGSVSLERTVTTNTVVSLAAFEPGPGPIPEEGSSVAHVPPSVTVKAGRISARFVVRTEPPGTAPRKAIIVAAAGGTKTAVLTVTP